MIGAKSHKSASILVIDDNQTIWLLLKKYLTTHGYLVYVAENGEKGIQVAGDILPDLVLLDIMMPGMDGFEVCAHLKAHPGTRDIPVLFITTLSDVNEWQGGTHDPEAGEPADLVMTDLNMPVMDGERFLKWIKGSPRTHDIPVVMISSASNPAKERQVLDLGAYAVIGKPVSPEILRRSVGDLMESTEHWAGVGSIEDEREEFE